MGQEDKQDAPPQKSQMTEVSDHCAESAELWKARNREATIAYNRQVSEEGVFSDGLRAF